MAICRSRRSRGPWRRRSGACRRAGSGDEGRPQRQQRSRRRPAGSGGRVFCVRRAGSVRTARIWLRLVGRDDRRPTRPLGRSRRWCSRWPLIRGESSIRRSVCGVHSPPAGVGTPRSFRSVQIGGSARQRGSGAAHSRTIAASVGSDRPPVRRVAEGAAAAAGDLAASASSSCLRGSGGSCRRSPSSPPPRGYERGTGRLGRQVEIAADRAPRRRRPPACRPRRTPPARAAGGGADQGGRRSRPSIVPASRSFSSRRTPAAPGSCTQTRPGRRTAHHRPAALLRQPLAILQLPRSPALALPVRGNPCIDPGPCSHG